MYAAGVCQGMGIMDFESDLDRIKLIYSSSTKMGTKRRKRQLARRGIKYVVAKRVPADGLEVRSSTSIKASLNNK